MQLPAPTYIDYVMTWVQNLLDDENVFPTKSGTYRNPALPSAFCRPAPDIPPRFTFLPFLPLSLYITP